MTTHYVAERTVAGYDLSFEWHGGAYIDVAFAGNGKAFDVINVWSAYHDRPMIERTREAFEAEVDEYLNDHERDLKNDLPNYWQAVGGKGVKA